MLPIASITVVEYEDDSGHRPFEKWFNRLNARAAAKVTTAREEKTASRHRKSKGPLGGLQAAKETESEQMALTRDFKKTIRARAKRDPEFRRALLMEAVETLLAGDTDTGKAVLRDYINATIGFETLGRSIDKSSKSIMRMLGPKGNPRSQNLFQIIGYLQKTEGVSLKVRSAE